MLYHQIKIESFFMCGHEKNWIYISANLAQKPSFYHDSLPDHYEKITMENDLKEIWYDPGHPATFSGPSNLHQVVKQEG